jgi:hypothetical protein
VDAIVSVKAGRGFGAGHRGAQPAAAESPTGRDKGTQQDIGVDAAHTTTEARDHRVRLDVTRGTEQADRPTKGRDEQRELWIRDMQVRSQLGAQPPPPGALPGTPSYQYDRGPDGRFYAVELGADPLEPPPSTQQLRESMEVAEPSEAAAEQEAADTVAEPPPTPLPIETLESSALSERVEDFADPGALDRTARAYREAAELDEAPGGTEDNRSIEVFG